MNKKVIRTSIQPKKYNVKEIPSIFVTYDTSYLIYYYETMYHVIFSDFISLFYVIEFLIETNKHIPQYNEYYTSLLMKYQVQLMQKWASDGMDSNEDEKEKLGKTYHHFQQLQSKYNYYDLLKNIDTSTIVNDIINEIIKNKNVEIYIKSITSFLYRDKTFDEWKKENSSYLNEYQNQRLTSIYTSLENVYFGSISAQRMMKNILSIIISNDHFDVAKYYLYENHTYISLFEFMSSSYGKQKKIHNTEKLTHILEKYDYTSNDNIDHNAFLIDLMLLLHNQYPDIVSIFDCVGNHIDIIFNQIKNIIFTNDSSYDEGIILYRNIQENVDMYPSLSKEDTILYQKTECLIINTINATSSIMTSTQQNEWIYNKIFL